MLSNRIIFLFFSLISIQVCAMERDGVNILPALEKDVQINQIYLNSVIVKFNDISPYQKVNLTILGQDIVLERNKIEHIFEQRLLIDPTKNLRVSYELFPGEMNLGIMMIDKDKFIANSVYDLFVDVGDRGAYAVKVSLQKK